MSESNELLSRLKQNRIRSERSNNVMMLLKIIHYLFDLVLFFIAFVWFRYDGFDNIYPVGYRYNYFVALLYGIILYFYTRTYNANNFGFFGIRNLALSQMISQFFSVSITYFMVCAAWKLFKAPWPFLIILPLQFIVDVLWTYLCSFIFFKSFPKRRTLLIYRNDLDRMRFGAITGKPVERIHQIVEEIQYDGSFEELKPRLGDYDALFVAGVNIDCRNGLLKYCNEYGVTCYFLPHIGDVIMQGSTHIKSFDSPILYNDRKTLDPLYAFSKRTFDIVSSGLALILLSPLMIVIALIIKCSDKGPALYKQTRLTKDGKTFEILKFRSMRVDAEKDGVARLSSGENDDRITPIGRFIRRFRIDELPQLINIFKGDMSVVGPRPERPEIAEQYYKSIPEFMLRLQVKAGLTGYAQVYGKYNTDPYEKLEFDLLYINQMNIVTDLMLCFATFFTFFLPDSTEGIAEGQTTAMDEVPAGEDRSH